MEKQKKKDYAGQVSQQVGSPLLLPPPPRPWGAKKGERSLTMGLV